jgi:hypothetical protein
VSDGGLHGMAFLSELSILSVNCKSRETKLNVRGFEEYILLKKKTGNGLTSLDLLLAFVRASSRAFLYGGWLSLHS